MLPYQENLAPFFCHLQQTPYFEEPYTYVDTPAYMSTIFPHLLQISNPKWLLGFKGTTIFKKKKKEKNQQTRQVTLVSKVLEQMD